MKKARIFTAVEETDPIEGKILVITDLWYNGRAEVKRTRQSVKAQAIAELEAVGIEVIRESESEGTIYLVSDNFLPNIVAVVLRED